MKTAIYVRVSTEEQANEGYSISGQMKRLKAFCLSQNWDVAGIYADEGISAKDMERPELQRMLRDIKKGQIECVLVYRLDRLTRSVLDLYKMLETFEKYDCKFKSATEVYDTTTAMGRMFITIVAALAQWERENMGERIAFGFEEKARQGKYPLNFAPLGYDLKKEESKLYINEREAKIVRKIFKLYQDGKGFGRVAKYLNERGIYTKDGNEWSDNTTMKIITNPVFYGYFRWNGQIYKGEHEAIISKDEWDKAQKIIESRRSKPGRSVSSRYIFAAKLKCPNCGGNMNGYYVSYTRKSDGVTTRYYNYRCRNKRNGRCDSSRSIAEDQLEKAFVDYLTAEDYSKFFDGVAANAEKSLNTEDESHIDLENLKKELKRIESRKKQWMFAWGDDAIEYEDFKNLMSEANIREQEIKDVLEEYESLSPKKEYLNKEEIITILKDIKVNWEHLENMEKKNLIDSTIDEIHINPVKEKDEPVEITRIIFNKNL